jgi:hypothetical protein
VTHKGIGVLLIVAPAIEPTRLIGVYLEKAAAGECCAGKRRVSMSYELHYGKPAGSQGGWDAKSEREKSERETALTLAIGLTMILLITRSVVGSLVGNLAACLGAARIRNVPTSA